MVDNGLPHRAHVRREHLGVIVRFGRVAFLDGDAHLVEEPLVDGGTGWCLGLSDAVHVRHQTLHDQYTDAPHVLFAGVGLALVEVRVHVFGGSLLGGGWWGISGGGWGGSGWGGSGWGGGGVGRSRHRLLACRRQLPVRLQIVRFRKVDKPHVPRLRTHQHVPGFEVRHDVVEFVEQPDSVHHLAQDRDKLGELPPQGRVVRVLGKVHRHVLHLLVDVQRCVVVRGRLEDALIESAVHKERLVRFAGDSAVHPPLQLLEHPLVRPDLLQVPGRQHHLHRPVLGNAVDDAVASFADLADAVRWVRRVPSAGVQVVELLEDAGVVFVDEGDVGLFFGGGGWRGWHVGRWGRVVWGNELGCLVIIYERWGEFNG